ncbi:hypothetical protein BLNAU_15571 [Blattamonas nauphoetae]|uniref:FF domain-containing protein n=1 Tax=Blattamonas nauphoetae TaxID=2049346 RepID=A0ABQ9XAJ0_9EUKA|nr:hypothetical protein BLNAU_15571 [Blattamonas nauphoetae]
MSSRQSRMETDRHPRRRSYSRSDNDSIASNDRSPRRSKMPSRGRRKSPSPRRTFPRRDRSRGRDSRRGHRSIPSHSKSPSSSSFRSNSSYSSSRSSISSSPRRKARSQRDRALKSSKTASQIFREIVESCVCLPCTTYEEAMSTYVIIPEQFTQQIDSLSEKEKKNIFDDHARRLTHRSAVHFEDMLDRLRSSIKLHQPWSQAKEHLKDQPEFSEISKDWERARIYNKWTNTLIEEGLWTLDRWMRENKEFQSSLRAKDASMVHLRQLLRKEKSYKRLKHLSNERDSVIYRYVSTINSSLKEEIEQIQQGEHD